MSNQNEYKLSFTAEQIDEILKEASSAVLYTEQVLTEKQKAQVRANIGAATVVDVISALPVYKGEVV